MAKLGNTKGEKAMRFELGQQTATQGIINAVSESEEFSTCIPKLHNYDFAINGVTSKSL